ncbi:flagellar hook-length control protein flik [hydrocarbon metagenome]|uniref:Flagellar hook-length control protein flik n=1 Tax=hydrocarbon metagenome TaxID=938273 RepID=A0A0W8E6C7_9ZZZZ
MFQNILHPTEDAYISQFYANTNFGGMPFLYTNRYQGPADEYQSLLKFDGIFGKRFDKRFDHHGHRRVLKFRSQLRLRIYRNEVPSSATLLVHKVLGSWSELNVTWNNRPAIDPTPIGSIVINAGFFGFIDINLDHFADCLDHGILLKCDEPFNSLLGFYSREFSDSSFWPQLTVSGAIVDDVEKPVITITPMAAAVTLSPDLIRVPRDRDVRRIDRRDRICDGVRRLDRRTDRICDGVRRLDRRTDRICDKLLRRSDRVSRKKIR